MSSSQRDIIIVSEFYPPSTGATSQLVHDLSLYLASVPSTHVTVITSTAANSWSQSKPFLTINRFANPWGRKYAGTSIIAKAIKGVLFYLQSLFWLAIYCRRNTTILFVSNPPFIVTIGLLLYILRRQNYFFLYQDIFPRSAQISGVIPSRGPVAFIWSLVINLSVRHSRNTIVLSKAMLLRLLREEPSAKATCIYNWAVETSSKVALRQNPLALSWNLPTDSLIIHYSGNFGRLHDILTILESVRLLHGFNATFLFVGSGSKSTLISKYQEHFNLQNLILKPPVSRKDLPYNLALADICIVSLVYGAEDTVAPSKLNGILGSGKPVLAICSKSSLLYSTIETQKVGICVEPGDPLALVIAIKKLINDPHLLPQLKRNAQLFSSSWNPKLSSLRKYDNVIKNL